MSTATDNLRNIAVLGHGGTGKSSLIEQILFTGGMIPKPERVESGKTVSDFKEDEIARNISIYTSLVHLSWRDCKINLLDTPGSYDFVGEVVAALRAAESSLVVVGADVGVQIETIKLWRRIDSAGMPRMVFINKMDREHADFSACLEDMRSKFDATFVPIAIPIGGGAGYRGVIDLISQKAFLDPKGEKDATPQDIPADLRDQVEEYKQALVEAAAEGDDSLLEKYFEEGTLSTEEVATGLAKACSANKVVPVLCGSALLNSGVRVLLDTIAAAAPKPEGTVKGAGSDGSEIATEISEKGPASVFVFKMSIDQFTGKLLYVKVIAGKIAADAELLNTRTGTKERISKLYSMQV